MNKDLPFMNYIATKFYQVKELFANNMKKLGLAFDEDVFSQTIIQCNEKLTKEDIEKRDVINYFWVAFKNNTLRDLKYTRNKMKSEFAEDVIMYDYDIDEDFNYVTKLIIEEFGEELYQLFALHANGMPYEQLHKMTEITNLKYEFRKIREFVRKNYDKIC